MQLYPKLILDALAKVRYPGNGKDLVATPFYLWLILSSLDPFLRRKK